MGGGAGQVPAGGRGLSPSRRGGTGRRGGPEATPWGPVRPGADRAAVLGSPITHSLSPALHTAAYRALGLDWTYEALETPEPDLPVVAKRLRTEPGWAGVSVTMPLKTAVIEVMDALDERVALLGAMNTVVVRAAAGGGVRLTGHNTDVDGIGFALERAGHPGPIAPAVLGAGGTARAALGALAERGAGRVTVCARRTAGAAPLVSLGERLGVEVSVRDFDDAPAVVAAADVVVATTPAGSTDDLAARPWPPGVGLVELLYHPWPTALARAASAAGAPLAGGIVVLAAQAAGQVSAFTGRAVDVEVLLEAGRRALAGRSQAG